MKPYQTRITEKVSQHLSIQTKLSMILLAITTAILIGYGIYQYVNRKTTLTTELRYLGAFATERLASNLRIPLWDFNRLAIEETILSEMQEKRISAVVIKEQDGETYIMGKMRDETGERVDIFEEISGEEFLGSDLVLTYEITYVGEILGVVELHLTQKYMVAELQNDIRKIMGTILVLDLSLLLCLILALRRMLLDPIKRLLTMAYAIAHGDFTQTITIRQQDEIGELAEAFRNMQEMIAHALQETETLIQAVQDGNLEIRGNAAGFAGDWSKLVVGVNNVIDAFVAPIIMAEDALDRLSKGEIPQHITDVYQGDFNTIKNNLNMLIEATNVTAKLAEDIAHGQLEVKVQERSEHDRLMQALNRMIRRLNGILHEMESLIQAIHQGQLEARGNAAPYNGGWRDLVVGMNKVIDAHAEMSSLNEQLLEENLRMSAELEITRRLQEMILPAPEELQQIEGLDIVGFMEPAAEVGGDYYDVFTHNDRVHIGVGDVTGHGLESGVLMLMTQTAIRTLIDHGETDPVAFLTTLNRTLYNNIQRMKVDKCLTLLFVNYQNGYLKIVGQHEELLVVRQGGHVERVDTIDLGFPIGLEEDIAKWAKEATMSLQPGEAIVLYTDGITEAENAKRELYGVERLCHIVSQHWNMPAEAIKRAVIDDVHQHIGTQKIHDDLTLVVLKQLGVE